jgi:hypothetical protein
MLRLELCAMTTEQTQRSIIAAALFSIKSPAALPSAYEQLLATQYIDGTLTLCQSIELLEAHYRHHEPSAISER